MARVNHPLFARLYHRMRRQEQALGVTEQRRELLAGLTGRVLEVGAGDGGNFDHYPSEVSVVVAVEPEPQLRRYAAVAARHSPIPVTVLGGTAERLPVADGAFDAVVASLVLCSVADPAAAVAEILRALRPGGELRFYEHVRAEDRRLARAQRLAAPVQARLGGGCRPDRDTLTTLADGGLVLEKVRRFDFHPTPLVILDRTRVIGVARRPAQVRG